jgi:hypothetical protein
MIAMKASPISVFPVSDVSRSREVVGCRHLSTVSSGHMALLDAAGTCLILVKRDQLISSVLEDHGGVLLLPTRLIHDGVVCG